MALVAVTQWCFKTKLLNNHFALCSFINLDLSLLHTAHFGNSISLPFLVLSIFEFTFFCILFTF